MKVIFLDFDGVLNSNATRHKEPWKSNFMALLRELDPDHVRVLNEVVRQTGAKVVVSSDWRKFHTISELQQILSSAGFTGVVIDKTPELWGEIPGRPGERFERGHEIQDWLEQNGMMNCTACTIRTQHACKVCGSEGEVPAVENFVILDDSSDMAHLLPKLVHTNEKMGLLEEHIQEILKHLE